MHKVTIWERLVTPSDGTPAHFEHNHIEAGHVADLTPQPMCDSQRLHWAKAQWKKTFAFLDDSAKIVIPDKYPRAGDRGMFNIQGTVTGRYLAGMKKGTVLNISAAKSDVGKTKL